MDLGVGKFNRADILHEQERALEEQWIGERDDAVVRLTVFVQLHMNARELSQANREVVVGTRIIGAPALPARFASHARVETAAIQERTVEVGGLHPLGRLAVKASAAGPDPLGERD